MRVIDPELQERLDSGVTTLCRCWLVERRDGVVMGFTDHDEDVSFEGVVFAAATGMTASALQQSTGLNVDNSQVAGALQAAGLTEEDIIAGLYDGAGVRHWLVDWTRPDLRILMFTGTLGEITRGELGFEVELRGLAEGLNRPVGRAFLRNCDALLGDGRCRVNIGLPALSAQAEVAVAQSNARFLVATLGAYAPGWFERGRLEWLSGANAGTVGQVKFDLTIAAGRLIELWQELARPIQAGDRFRIVAGCDKRAATCQEKFSNFLNFRGFPYMPGEDWVNGYVKDGERHDGSSLFG
ncbi:MAG TPA: DUF2163 domain-containing protein [Paracoccaceae bacterium]|nr:DUF2163 domain-containing protein [Paracoccaceae bacterium]